MRGIIGNILQKLRMLRRNYAQVTHIIRKLRTNYAEITHVAHKLHIAHKLRMIRRNYAEITQKLRRNYAENTQKENCEKIAGVVADCLLSSQPGCQCSGP